MNKINFIFKALLFSGLVFLTSCSNDDEEVIRGDFQNGILISGEGSGAGSGSISFISDDYAVNESKIYSNVNNADLGAFLQSVAFDNDNAYIVVDNQNTVTVADRYTFERVGEITTELQTPRYMAIDGNTGYITNWGDPLDGTDDFIAVIDLNTLNFVEKIPVSNGPEQIIVENNNLYVSHKGAWTTNNIVSVIDLDTNVVSAITVNDNPDEMYISGNDLIVLSEGRTLFDANFNVIGNTSGAISTIDLDTNEVSKVLLFEDGEHPSLMVVENGVIYYALGNSIHSISINDSSLSVSPLFSGADSFLYGLAVNDSKIYTLDASFSDVSTLNIFNTANTLIDSFEAPIGAAKIYFN